MPFRCTLALSLCLASAAAAQPRMAEVSCDDSARLAQRLTTVLGAERQATGLRDPETLLEIWVARKSGDWLIVQSYANGTSCIVAMGEGWESGLASPA